LKTRRKNRRSRIFLFSFFSRRRIFGDLYSLEQNRRRRIFSFCFFSRKEEEEYILIKY